MRGNGESRRGASEVIGVVLLVAVVVVLAGTVGYVVLGTERGRPATPTFSKVVDYDRSTDGDGQALEIEHGSGETTSTVSLNFVIEEARVVDTSTGTVQGDAVLKSGQTLGDQTGDEWKVGQTVVIDQTTMTEEGGTIDSGEHLDLREAKIKIVWVPENEGTSDVIFRWRGPDAPGPADDS